MYQIVVCLGIGLICLGVLVGLLLWVNRDQLLELEAVNRRIETLKALDMKADQQERTALEDRRNGYRNAIQNSRPLDRRH